MDGISVLSFILTYQISKERNENIELTVKGLLHHAKNDDEHLDWIKRHLKIGDEITVRVIETSNSTRPISKRREDPQLVEKARRRYYESLKKEYRET